MPVCIFAQDEGIGEWAPTLKNGRLDLGIGIRCASNSPSSSTTIILERSTSAMTRRLAGLGKIGRARSKERAQQVKFPRGIELYSGLVFLGAVILVWGGVAWALIFAFAATR